MSVSKFATHLNPSDPLLPAPYYVFFCVVLVDTTIFVNLNTPCNDLSDAPKAVEYHDRQGSRATLPGLGGGTAFVRVYSHRHVSLPFLVSQ